MAVTSMQAVNVIGLMDHIDETIMVLGESGAFHPDDVGNFYSDLTGFTNLQSKNNYAEPLTNLKSALNQAGKSLPQTDVSDFSPSFEELESYSAKATAEIDALVGKKNSAVTRLEETKQSLSVALRFSGLDIELQNIAQMKFLTAHFGKLPRESVEKLEAYRDTDYIEFSVCSDDETHCWGVYFTPNQKEDEINKIFERLYFEPTDLPEGKMPDELVKEYTALIPVLEKDTEQAQAALDSYLSENEAQLTRYLSKLEELYLYSGIRAKALQHNHSFIIVGWVPTENKARLRKRLKAIKSVELDFSDAKDELDKNPPVKLKNCFFARPFEFFTEMYGVPKYNEIDPTFFVAATYFVIFGIMFADVGQGFCLSIVGLLMWKLRKMAIGKILFPCGFSSMFFGLIFGSVFGFEELLDTPLEKLGLHGLPFKVMHSENINTVIFGAVGVGVVLLILAMFLNLYTSFRQKNYGRALFGTSGVAGIVFYCSIVFGLVSEIFLGNHVMSTPYILGLIVLPFILIFFSEPLGDLVNGEKDWQPESWGGYIVEKIFESLEILLSYVTNTMSFLRVGAFVLVHAGMMIVVFKLAETAGDVAYWPVVVIGNAVVMALEALLVSIQVLRLEFYEMFSRFYSGEGRPFERVRINPTTN